MNKIANTLQKGLDHYLDNWQHLQGKDIFPISSNEDSYRAKKIIDMIVNIQCALLSARSKDEIKLLDESTERICDFAEGNYKEYLKEIDRIWDQKNKKKSVSKRYPGKRRINSPVF